MNCLFKIIPSIKIFFFLTLFSFYKISAQTNDPKTIFQESINFLIKTQTDSTIEGKQYAGEWNVWMNLTEPYLFIGKAQKARDSNCFTVSAIHNFLSEIYLKDTSLSQIKLVLQKAFPEIQSYAIDQKYSFWKLLPPQRDLRFGQEPSPVPLVRRPTNYQLKLRFVNKLANGPEDSDDSSLGNLATFYHNKIFQDSLKTLSYKGFDEYLDKNRKNRNWYNFMLPSPKNSGAYMTWHQEETEVLFWNPVSALVSLLTIFTPLSSGYPVAYESYIPFGANDVDVVVNANVLSYLAETNQLSRSKGKNGAIKIINHAIDKSKWETAGIYYPNTYHLHYVVARAYQKGVSELKNTAEKVAKHLLSTQNEDGSFESKSWLNKKDIIQSTAYGLHAMLDLKEKNIEVPEKNIEKTVLFLISKAKRENDTCHWEGGVYFSGGTVVRNILIWQSDAYTTALIADCLQRYLKLRS